MAFVLLISLSPFTRHQKPFSKAFWKGSLCTRPKKAFAPKGWQKVEKNKLWTISSGCQDWLCFLLLLSTMGHKQGGSLHAFAMAALPTPSFSMPGFVHVLDKPFCNAIPIVGKPFCRAYSSCREALLQGSCGKALLQGLFGMHGKQLLFFSQHTLLCCFGASCTQEAKVPPIALLSLLSCWPGSRWQLQWASCFYQGQAHAAGTSGFFPPPIVIVSWWMSTFSVLSSSPFARPAAAFVGTSAAGFFKASFAEGFFIGLLPVAFHGLPERRPPQNWMKQTPRLYGGWGRRLPFNRELSKESWGRRSQMSAWTAWALL